MMIGDRSLDLIAARANDTTGVGVLYGYAGRAELEEAGAGYLLQHPLEIQEAMARVSER